MSKYLPIPGLPRLGGDSVEPHRARRTVYTVPWRPIGHSGSQQKADPAVLKALGDRGLRDRRPLIEHLGAPTVRRRPLGAIQECGGWWVGQRAAVDWHAQRPLEALEDCSFRPAGPWEVEGTRYELVDVEVTRRCYGPPGSKGAEANTKVLVVEATDPAQVLPDELARLIRGGDLDLYRMGRGGQIGQVAYGWRVGGGRLAALWRSGGRPWVKPMTWPSQGRHGRAAP